MALGIIGAIIRVDGHEAHLMIAELAVCVTMYVVDMCNVYVQMHNYLHSREIGYLTDSKKVTISTIPRPME